VTLTKLKTTESGASKTLVRCNQLRLAWDLTH